MASQQYDLDIEWQQVSLGYTCTSTPDGVIYAPVVWEDKCNGLFVRYWKGQVFYCFDRFVDPIRGFASLPTLGEAVFECWRCLQENDLPRFREKDKQT